MSPSLSKSLVKPWIDPVQQHLLRIRYRRSDSVTVTKVLNKNRGIFDIWFKSKILVDSFAHDNIVSESQCWQTLDIDGAYVVPISPDLMITQTHVEVQDHICEIRHPFQLGSKIFLEKITY